jgi:hypothetical protein
MSVRVHLSVKYTHNTCKRILRISPQASRGGDPCV